MNSLEYWRLCDQMSIHQATLLLIGMDPTDPEGCNADFWSIDQRPPGYEAVTTAIINAIRRDIIVGVIANKRDVDFDGSPLNTFNGPIQLRQSEIEVESFKSWLLSRGIRTGFFFPENTDAPDYLDPNNERYAPKLAAAVSAWQSVNSSDLGGKHPKQALSKWLRENAAQFGMTDDEGKPNETGIEEAAKVANWQPGGGAPRTPGG